MAFSFCVSFSFWWRWWLVHAQCPPSHPPLLLHQQFQMSCSRGMAMRIVWASQTLWRIFRDPRGSAEHSVRTTESGIPSTPPDCGLVGLGLPRDAALLWMRYSFPNLFLIFKNEPPPGWAWGHFCPSCSLFCLWSQDSGPKSVVTTAEQKDPSNCSPSQLMPAE